MTPASEFKRPGTRYILTRITDGADSDIAECATLVDIVTALVRWYPEEELHFATVSPTGVVFWSDDEEVIATMREVFE